MASNPSYKCPHCPFATPWNFAMDIHFKCHVSFEPFDCATKIEVFQCQKCPFKTKLQLDLFEHGKNHPQLPKFTNNWDHNYSKSELNIETPELQCVRCGLVTFSNIFLMKHLTNCEITMNDSFTSKIEKKLFYCPQCYYKTQVRKYFLKHLRCNHIPVKECKQFECSDCRYRTKLKTRSVSPKMEWLKCNYCNFQTCHIGYLNNHQTQKHLYVPPWKSLRETELGGNLENHKKTSVKKIKWVECEHCSYKANSRGSLKSHQLFKHASSTEIKWLECKECDFKTKTSKCLSYHQTNKHMPIEKIKWLKCSDCHFKTKYLSTLKRHRINLHNYENQTKWFKCNDCYYEGKGASDLKAHRLGKHFRNIKEILKCKDCD